MQAYCNNPAPEKSYCIVTTLCMSNPGEWKKARLDGVHSMQLQFASLQFPLPARTHQQVEHAIKAHSLAKLQTQPKTLKPEA
jgi:hypothetical protein